MKLLCVQPGASYATADVHDGLVGALRQQGHEIVGYQLDQRIDRAGGWLKYCWEKGGKTAAKPTPADIVYLASVGVIERALRHQPDWVLVFSGMYFHPDVFVMLRRAGIRGGLILSESPYDLHQEMQVAPLVDVVWTNERSCVTALRHQNLMTFYLPHAYDPEKHRPFVDAGFDDDVPAHDVVFVGSGFQERVELLSAVDWRGIDFGLYGAWESLPPRHRLRKHLRGKVVDNATAAALYRRAKISLNLYRTSIGFGRYAPRIERADSLNPRAYELAACGAFHLSDPRPEVLETFGAAVPTFRNPREAGDLIRRFLADDVARREHATRARRAIAPHTFAARAAQLTADLARVQRPLERSA